MVPDPEKSCIGLEYFCFEGDDLWNMPDEELIELGKRELELLGLVNVSDVEDGKVVRMPKAYPIYDSTYQESLGVVRAFLDRIENFQVITHYRFQFYHVSNLWVKGVNSNYNPAYLGRDITTQPLNAV